MDEQRQGVGGLLTRSILLAATAGLSLLNGLPFSPVFDSVFFYVPRLVPGFLHLGMDTVFNITLVLIGLMTLALAGVPAAIYERARGLEQSTPMSLAIWLAGALGLAFPSARVALDLL